MKTLALETPALSDPALDVQHQQMRGWGTYTLANCQRLITLQAQVQQIQPQVLSLNQAIQRLESSLNAPSGPSTRPAADAAQAFGDYSQPLSVSPTGLREIEVEAVDLSRQMMQRSLQCLAIANVGLGQLRSLGVNP